MNHLIKYIVYTFLVLISSITLAQNEALFEQGTALYNEGDYDGAIAKYEEIINNKKHSAELYFNLANAHYKLNHIAPSIYYYEKALQLSPNDKDVQNNIAFARNMTIDAIETVPEIGVSKLVKNVTHMMSFDSWAYTASGLVFLFVILFLIYYFAYNTTQKRLAFIGSIMALILFFTALAFAFHKYNLVKNDKPAIVFSQESKVKTEPNLRSEEAFRLHEGTKVQVIGKLNNWIEIKLTDGKTGWVASADLKMLNEF